LVSDITPEIGNAYSVPISILKHLKLKLVRIKPLTPTKP